MAVGEATGYVGFLILKHFKINGIKENSISSFKVRLMLKIDAADN